MKKNFQEINKIAKSIYTDVFLVYYAAGDSTNVWSPHQFAV